MSNRKELISTDSEEIEVDETKYRVKVSVRYRRSYHIQCSVFRIEGSTPYEALDSTTRMIQEKDAVQQKSQKMVEWGVDRAREIEDATSLSIDIDATVSDDGK